MTRVIGDAILWPYIVIWASSQAKHECLSILKRIYRTAFQCKHYSPTEAKATGNIEAIVEWKRHERASKSVLKKQSVGDRIPTSNRNPPPTRRSGNAKVEALQNNTKRNYSVFNVQHSANKLNLHPSNNSGTQSLRASPILRDFSRCEYIKCSNENEAKINSDQSSTIQNKNTDLDLRSLLDGYSSTLNTSQSTYHGSRKDLPVSVKTKCNISKDKNTEMRIISDMRENKNRQSKPNSQYWNIWDGVDRRCPAMKIADKQMNLTPMINNPFNRITSVLPVTKLDRSSASYNENRCLEVPGFIRSMKLDVKNLPNVTIPGETDYEELNNELLLTAGKLFSYQNGEGGNSNKIGKSEVCLKLEDLLGKFDCPIRNSINAIMDPIRKCNNVRSLHEGDREKMD